MEFKKVLTFSIATGWNIVFDNDENSEIEHENSSCSRNINIKGYLENIVPRMLPHQFKMHFRILPSTFEVMSKNLAEFVCNKPVSRRPEISVHKQLVITLWYLANPECFRTIANKFNLERISCFRVVFRTCERIMELNVKKRIISWRSSEEIQRSNLYFKEKSKFPGVIGAIDGSHIYIKAPKDHPNSYVNRRGRHSIILQGICNEKKKFIDVYGGEVGSLHDGNVMKRSDVFKRIQDGNIRLPPECHLVGDSAYPLLTSLMVPYKNNGHLARKHKNFNRALSKARVVIENTFGLLKMRFRRLNLIENRRLDFIAMIVMTCCILHNICMELHDIPTGEIISNGNGVENNVHDIQIDNQLRIADVKRKRDLICNTLP